MAKKKSNPEEINEVNEAVEVKVEETVQELPEESVEKTVEETVEESAEEKVEESFKEEKAPLKTKLYQHPDDLCDFVNTNDVLILSIVSFDRFQALYYVEK